jgi:hypothetical protein
MLILILLIQIEMELETEIGIDMLKWFPISIPYKIRLAISVFPFIFISKWLVDDKQTKNVRSDCLLEFSLSIRHDPQWPL